MSDAISKLQRYEFFDEFDQRYLRQKSDGDYILYDDVIAALQAEQARQDGMVLVPVKAKNQMAQITLGCARFCAGVIDNNIALMKEDEIKQSYRGRLDEILRAIEMAESFCVSHCTWLNHHPDCPINGVNYKE